MERARLVFMAEFTIMKLLIGTLLVSSTVICGFSGSKALREGECSFGCTMVVLAGFLGLCSLAILKSCVPVNF